MSPSDELGPLLRREARRIRVDPRTQLQERIIDAVRHPEAAPAPAPLQGPSWGWRLAGAGALLASAAGIVLAMVLTQAPTMPPAAGEGGIAQLPPARSQPQPAPVSAAAAPSPLELELPSAQPLRQELDDLASDLAQGGSFLLAAMPAAPRHS